MENYIDILIRRYIRLGLAIDTNLMLLFLVGRLDLQKIGKFKSTSKFSIRNFQLLDRIVTKFPRKYTTSNVMTEVDNLSRQVPRSE